MKKKYLTKLRTGKAWSQKLKVEVISFHSGWKTKKEYCELKISEDEFLDKLTQSVYVPIEDITLKNEIYKKCKY